MGSNQTNSPKELFPILSKLKESSKIPMGVVCPFELRGDSGLVSDITWAVQKARDGLCGYREWRSEGDIVDRELPSTFRVVRADNGGRCKN